MFGDYKATGPAHAAEFLERVKRQRARIDARYAFDFDICPPNQGWAQLDTEQDAWYFGTWADPAHRLIVTYAEGDVSVQGFADDPAFVEGVRKWERWTAANHDKPGRIDPGLDPDYRATWERLGLADLLH